MLFNGEEVLITDEFRMSLRIQWSNSRPSDCGSCMVGLCKIELKQSTLDFYLGSENVSAFLDQDHAAH